MGSAPTYDDWDVVLRLRDRAGKLVATKRLDVELGDVLPGRRTFRSTMRLRKVPAGTYAMSLAVTDPSGYLAPMNLAIQGRTADGDYRVGRLRVTR